MTFSNTSQKIKFFVDSGADLNYDLCKMYSSNILPEGISIIKAGVSIEEEDYLSDPFWIDTPKNTFFNSLHSKKLIKPFQPSFFEWAKIFEKAVLDGYQVLFLCMSKEFAGGYKQATISKDILVKKYPGCVIEIVDSKNVAAGLKLLALKVAKDLSCKNEIDLSSYAEYVRNEYVPKTKVFCICNNGYRAYMSGRVKKAENTDNSLCFTTTVEGNLETVYIEKNKELILNKILLDSDNIKSYEISYTADLDYGYVINITDTLIGKCLTNLPHHSISYASPSCTTVVGPDSFFLGVEYK